MMESQSVSAISDFGMGQSPRNVAEVEEREDLRKPKKQTDVEEQVVEISWDMFDIESTLGTGAFGDVYKVKCKTSTKLAESGMERVLVGKGG